MTYTKLPRELRIAVLEAVQFGDNITQFRGQFGDIFQAWLVASVASYNSHHQLSQRLRVTVSRWNVTNDEYPPTLEGFDGIIVSGSPSSCYEDIPWIKTLARYLQDVYDNFPQVKLFGSCFGHQLISASILGRDGVIVEKSPTGWEIGVHPVSLNEKFKKDFPLLQDQSSLACQFLHADHVVLDKAVLPEGWTAVGSSKLCEVQGMYFPGRVLTLQGHPELDPFLNEQIAMLVGMNSAIVFDQVMSYMSQIHKEDDSILYGETLVEFFAR